MSRQEIEIRPREHEPVPYDLLLLADPSLEVIERYLHSSDLFLAIDHGDIVGVLVLKKDNGTSEIMNVAVQSSFQGMGIGSKLIKHAIGYSRHEGQSKVLIGTADTSTDQLALYQKLGFCITGSIKDFFIKNYKEPIYENGKQAKDMIRLELSLT